MKRTPKNKTDALYQAMLTRDPRFDGKFFIGVKTTGIYCRPICPARPKPKNVEFFPDALSAEKSGYRPCLRCRPECAPGSKAWVGKSAIVGRALRLISNNKLLELDEDEFADLLGVTARHLRRLFDEELGKTPKQISDIHRLDFARKLLTETSLPATDVAFASGFSSVRRFNDAMKKRFHRAPSGLRRAKADPMSSERGIELSLSFRPPLDWHSLLHFFSAHQISGVESVSEEAYERVFRFEESIGVVKARACFEKSEIKLRVVTDDYKHVFRVAQKIRQMFDLDSDPSVVANCFSGSALLSELCGKYPGLRVPTGWDAFEIAICSILGQLVSTEQARKLVEQLVENYGEKVIHPISGKATYLFPSPEILAHEPLERVGTTKIRKESIREFSSRVLSRAISLDATQDPAMFRESLLKIKGIGPWTAEYISLRALGDADAFPHADLILKRATELHSDLDVELLRPWRSYAAMYLWKEYAKPLSRKGKKTREKRS